MTEKRVVIGDVVGHPGARVAAEVKESDGRPAVHVCARKVDAIASGSMLARAVEDVCANCSHIVVRDPVAAAEVPTALVLCWTCAGPLMAADAEAEVFTTPMSLETALLRDLPMEGES